jgi:hypothetical protein
MAHNNNKVSQQLTADEQTKKTAEFLGTNKKKGGVSKKNIEVVEEEKPNNIINLFELGAQQKEKVTFEIEQALARASDLEKLANTKGIDIKIKMAALEKASKIYLEIHKIKEKNKV